MATREEIENGLCLAVESCRMRLLLAKAVVDEVNNDIPSGLPHPDGVLRIKNANAAYSEARMNLMKALDNLNHFVCYGVIPKDFQF
jgi:hypothetical protein